MKRGNVQIFKKAVINILKETRRWGIHEVRTGGHLKEKELLGIKNYHSRKGTPIEKFKDLKKSIPPNELFLRRLPDEVLLKW